MCHIADLSIDSSTTYCFINGLGHNRKYTRIKEMTNDSSRTSSYQNFNCSELLFQVYCDQKTAGGGWAVFQKRQDGSVSFYRAWNDYKKGFGDLKGEFWLGLDKIHRLTRQTKNKLRVDLQDFKGKSAYAEYDFFAVYTLCILWENQFFLQVCFTNLFIFV